MENETSDYEDDILDAIDLTQIDVHASVFPAVGESGDMYKADTETRSKNKRKTSSEIHNTDRQPERLANGNWKCSHKCKNRQTCKHTCCREGLESKPKPKRKKLEHEDNVVATPVATSQSRLNLASMGASTSIRPRQPAEQIDPLSPTHDKQHRLPSHTMSQSRRPGVAFGSQKHWGMDVSATPCLETGQDDLLPDMHELHNTTIPAKDTPLEKASDLDLITTLEHEVIKDCISDADDDLFDDVFNDGGRARLKSRDDAHEVSGPLADEIRSFNFEEEQSFVDQPVTDDELVALDVAAKDQCKVDQLQRCPKQAIDMDHHGTIINDDLLDMELQPSAPSESTVVGAPENEQLRDWMSAMFGDCIELAGS